MIDEGFTAFSELIEDLSDLNGMEYDTVGQDAVSMEIENVEMELPIELSISVDDSGMVEIGGTPPQYLVETTVMPVFHRLNLKLVRISEFDKDGE
jgi:hypothetical protein